VGFAFGAGRNEQGIAVAGPSVEALPPTGPAHDAPVPARSAVPESPPSPPCTSFIRQIDGEAPGPATRDAHSKPPAEPATTNQPGPVHAAFAIRDVMQEYKPLITRECWDTLAPVDREGQTRVKFVCNVEPDGRVHGWEILPVAGMEQPELMDCIQRLLANSSIKVPPPESPEKATVLLELP